jgi:hypothetical protein
MKNKTSRQKQSAVCFEISRKILKKLKEFDRR